MKRLETDCIRFSDLNHKEGTKNTKNCAKRVIFESFVFLCDLCGENLRQSGLEIRDWRLSREIGDWRLGIARGRQANLQSLISNLLITGALLFLVALPVSAQSTQPEDQMYQIAKQLNCPTCAGRNLADCPTDTCTQWKQEITTQLKAGKSDAEVLAYFKDRFGSQVLQEPPKEGFLLVMWVMPIVAVIGLIALAVFVARRSSSSVKLSSVASPTQASDYETRLEQQVKDAS